MFSAFIFTGSVSDGLQSPVSGIPKRGSGAAKQNLWGFVSSPQAKGGLLCRPRRRPPGGTSEARAPGKKADLYRTLKCPATGNPVAGHLRTNPKSAELNRCFFLFADNELFDKLVKLRFILCLTVNEALCVICSVNNQ